MLITLKGQIENTTLKCTFLLSLKYPDIYTLKPLCIILFGVGNHSKRKH